MKTIPLTQGKVALVDDADYDWLSQFKWTYQRGSDLRGYAIHSGKGPHSRRVRLFMHREIIRPSGGLQVDHVDGNGLNNQRENLREATASQNRVNRIKRGGTLKFKGLVRPRTPNNGWQACIKILGKRIYLGTYKTQEEAARAYDTAARKYFGEFAATNFP